jgi:hypothetical protein
MREESPFKEVKRMLWLLAGVVLFVIAIAGGTIVHPVLFALGVIALLIFFSGWGGGRTYA